MNVTGTEQWNWNDGSGQRVMRRTSVGGTVSYTVYAFGLEEHQYNASGTNTGNTSSYSVGGHLIGEQTGTSTKTTTFLLTDLLGSVVASFSVTHRGAPPCWAPVSMAPTARSSISRGVWALPKASSWDLR